MEVVRVIKVILLLKFALLGRYEQDPVRKEIQTTRQHINYRLGGIYLNRSLV